MQARAGSSAVEKEKVICRCRCTARAPSPSCTSPPGAVRDIKMPDFHVPAKIDQLRDDDICRHAWHLARTLVQQRPTVRSHY